MNSPRPTLEQVVANATASRATIPNGRQRIAKFQTACDELEVMIRGWLQPQVEDGAVEFEKSRSKVIMEQGFTYPVVTFAFNLAGRYVELEPRATWVIGAYGRADITAQPGRTEFLTLNENFDWEVPRKTGRKFNYDLLDRDTFAAVLSRALTLP